MTRVDQCPIDNWQQNFRLLPPRTTFFIMNIEQTRLLHVSEYGKQNNGFARPARDQIRFSRWKRNRKPHCLSRVCVHTWVRVRMYNFFYTGFFWCVVHFLRTMRFENCAADNCASVNGFECRGIVWFLCRSKLICACEVWE